MIAVDIVFFDRVVKTLETNQNLLRRNSDRLKLTEAWIAFGDQLINQCKEMIKVEKYNTERDAVFNDFSDIQMEGMPDHELFNLVVAKTLESYNEDGEV
jgi:hypothetical protein